MRRIAALVALLLGPFSAAHSVEFPLPEPVAPYGVFWAHSARSLPKGEAAVALGLQYAREPNFHLWSFRCSYGLRDNLEVALGLPYMDAPEDSGPQGLSLSLKWRPLEESTLGVSLALLAVGFVSLGQEQLDRQGGLGGGLALSRRLGPFRGHLNALWISPARDGLHEEWDLIGGLDFSASHRLRLLGEVLLRSTHESNDLDALELRLGYRVVSEDFLSTVGLGVDLKNRQPEYRLMLTVALPLMKK
jgi:hypothetical protein